MLTHLISSHHSHGVLVTIQMITLYMRYFNRKHFARFSPQTTHGHEFTLIIK